MKKIISVLLLACMLTGVLAGCQKQDAPVPENLDLTEVYTAILDAQGEKKNELVLLEEPLDGDYIQSAYPGVTDVACKQLVAYVAPVAGFATEIILAETEKDEDVQTVKDIFQSRIDAAKSDTFYPDTAAFWEKNAQIQNVGRYVAMIVLPDGYTIPENVFVQDAG